MGRWTGARVIWQGYTQCNLTFKPPAIAALPQLEDYDEQLYKVSGKTDDPEGSTDKYMIATSEQPMCGFHRKEWLQEDELPKVSSWGAGCHATNDFHRLVSQRLLVVLGPFNT